MLATLPVPRSRACIHILYYYYFFFISFNRGPVIYLFAPLFCSDNEKPEDKKNMYATASPCRRCVWAHSSFGSLKVKLKTSRIYSSAKRFFSLLAAVLVSSFRTESENARTHTPAIYIYKCVKLHFQKYASCVYERFVIIL